MAEDPGPRPQPVLYSQLITVATAVVGLLVAFNVPLDAAQQAAVLGVVGAVVALVALGAAAWARNRVTPLSDPRDDQGRALVARTVRAPAASPVIAPPGDGPPVVRRPKKTGTSGAKFDQPPV